MRKLLFILLLPALAKAQPSGVKTNYGPSWFQQLYTTPSQVDVLDTTNYKVAVFNSNGQLFKSYWPSGGGGSQDLNSVLGVGNSSTNSILLTGNDNTTNSRLRVGSFEVQPYALNNTILFDNARFDAAFKFRNDGYASYLQFYDGQFNLAATASPGTAGANATFVNRLNINTSGAITFNNAYTFPASAGSAGQALRMPASGTALEWFTPGSGGSSQWVDGSGGDIYYNSGYVGINTSNPEYPLHINSAGNGPLPLRVSNTSSGSAAYSSLWLSSDDADLLFNVYSSTSSGFGPVGARGSLMYAGGTGGLGIVANAGGLILSGNSGVTINTSTNSFTLPTGRGTNGYVLTTNGSGGTSWTSVSGGSSPLTTNGDLYTRISGADARLGIGSEGNYLRVTSGLPSWGNFTSDVRGQFAAGTGISIVSGVISTSNTGQAPTATFYANTSGSGSGDMTGTMSCGSGEAGYFVVHLNINRTDNAGHYWREFRVPFVRNTTTLTFPELEYEIFVGDDAGFTYTSTITLANDSGNLKITYNTNGGNLNWTAVVYKYYAVNAL